jgi:hypothetical protein
LSASVFWEGLEKLLQASGSDSPVFRSRAEFDYAKDLLWNLYENLSVVINVFSSISNYVYSWPEFVEMVQIAVQNPEYEISLGEHHWIKHKGGGGGGMRNIWTVLREHVAKAEHHSLLAHQEVMEIAERHPSVARAIAESAKAAFESSDYFTFHRDSHFLVTPLQFRRFKTVQEVLDSLDKIITAREQGHQGSLEGAWKATDAFHNAILLTDGIRQGVRHALKLLDSSLILSEGNAPQKKGE